jgi:hypothetical protein
MTETPSAPRRRWSFSLRKLFAALTLLLIVLGCISALVANRERRAIDKITQLGGEVFYRQSAPGNPLGSAPPRRHGSIRWLVGDYVFAKVEGVRIKGGDEAMRLLKAFPDVESVALYGDGFTVQALEDVNELGSLHDLELGLCSITPQELVNSPLASRIRRFVIYGEIDNEGLQALKGLRNLVSLVVGGPAVSEQAVAQLRKEMPDCVINQMLPMGGWNGVIRRFEAGE